jgi:hypothetical protein
MALLPVLPLQTSNEGEEAARDGLLQEIVIHRPQLPPEMVLVVLGQSWAMRRHRRC